MIHDPLATRPFSRCLWPDPSRSAKIPETQAVCGHRAPPDTREHQPNAVSMLYQRQRYWYNIEIELG